MSAKIARKRHLQLRLDRARKPDGKHGGWRPGAGRKKKPGAISHGPRPVLAPRFPQHVTLRIDVGIDSIAREWLMKIIRKAISQSHKGWFQIVEFNVLTNHLHLITEARDKLLLARGVQGLEVRIARRLNRALKRRGKLFAHRYHVRHLRTPREVRNALRYVLLNRKHHAAEQKFDRMWIDPYSSAPWFDGWAQPIRTTTDWKRELVNLPAPTAKATTWLLSTGWRRYGPLSFADCPAPS
jgi:REP element-mobilizing transposase RayT